jgi:hypothetical protein
MTATGRDRVSAQDVEHEMSVQRRSAQFCRLGFSPYGPVAEQEISHR